MARQITWIRKFRRSTAVATGFSTDDEKREILNAMECLGFEKVSGAPLYETKDFVVIDTVKDLDFAVLRVVDGGFQTMREIPLDKYEAIRIADEFQEALDG